MNEIGFMPRWFVCAGAALAASSIVIDLWLPHSLLVNRILGSLCALAVASCWVGADWMGREYRRRLESCAGTAEQERQWCAALLPEGPDAIERITRRRIAARDSKALAPSEEKRT